LSLGNTIQNIQIVSTNACAINSVKYLYLESSSINSPGVTLGELRNYSISKASGTYICVWDDDDWHNPHRLKSQLHDAIDNGKSGCILAYLPDA